MEHSARIFNTPANREIIFNGDQAAVMRLFGNPTRANEIRVLFVELNRLRELQREIYYNVGRQGYSPRMLVEEEVRVPEVSEQQPDLERQVNASEIPVEGLPDVD